MLLIYEWNSTKIFMLMILSIIILRFSIVESISKKAEESNYFWQESKEWSSCSVTCGTGSHTREMFCASKINTTVIKVSESYCNNLNKLNTRIKICYQNECPEKYIWKTSPWSQCSHSCGNLGIKSRDVECGNNVSGTNQITVDEILCANLPKPTQKQMCNKEDCPPEFITGKWKTCIKAPGCQPGKQHRDLKCQQILKSGEVVSLHLSKCYSQLKVPPSKWRKCYDFVNIPKCLKGVPARKVEFNVVNNNVYQMRHAKTVQLQIGQIGYLLPYARIILSCPVDNFPQHNIVWKHKNVSFSYSGKVTQRIRVDRLGQLRIRKLFFQDQGEWTCIAGKSAKSLIIKIRNPSSGFRDWAVRNNLWKTGMLSEDSKKQVKQQERIQWVTTEWSFCSVTCSGEGYQYREVHCEKVEPRFYVVLDDSDCEKVIPTPKKMKKCYISIDCPQWQFRKITTSKCSNECINVGVSLMPLELKCLFVNQEVPLQLCEENSKPLITCRNEACQLDWRYNSWSKCSKSCGGVGFQARSIVCVWKLSRKSAGSLCYDKKIPLPQVIRKCETDPCIMGCVDLSSQCVGDSRKCHYNLYRYVCCSTCRKYFSKNN